MSMFVFPLTNKHRSATHGCAPSLTKGSPGTHGRNIGQIRLDFARSETVGAVAKMFMILTMSCLYFQVLNILTSRFLHLSAPFLPYPIMVHENGPLHQHLRRGPLPCLGPATWAFVSNQTSVFPGRSAFTSSSTAWFLPGLSTIFPTHFRDAPVPTLPLRPQYQGC